MRAVSKFRTVSRIMPGLKSKWSDHPAAARLYEDGHRSVIGQRDFHHRPEPPGGYGYSPAAQLSSHFIHQELGRFGPGGMDKGRGGDLCERPRTG